MRCSTLLVTLLVAPLAHAAAQNFPVQPGQRVRVTVPSADVSKQQTAFQRMAGDTLVLSSAAYAMADVTRLDRYAGRRSHPWYGAGIGFLVGAAAGAVWGGSQDCSDYEQGYCAFIGAVLCAPAGALLGLAVGGVLWKTDKWEEVPLDHWRIGIAPTPNGRVGLAVSLSF